MSSSTARTTLPRPYNRTELRALTATLEARWPKLPPDEADRWLRRVAEGRSPYSRVRSHAIRCQLEAIIALGLYLGLRRSEIWHADVNDVDTGNFGVVVRDRLGDVEGSRVREVPWLSVAWDAMQDWLVCRCALSPQHDRPWLNLHAEQTMSDPMKRHTFDRSLTTYVGAGCSFRRLRCSSAVYWSRCGLPLERLRELLGVARIEDVLPYAQLAVTGSLEGDMTRLKGPFLHLVQQGAGWSNRPVPADLCA